MRSDLSPGRTLHTVPGLRNTRVRRRGNGGAEDNALPDRPDFPVWWGSGICPTSMGESAGVDLHDLARSFGEVEAVRGVSLHIEEGETVALLGPNGAGKTTTLSMLATLLAPSSGDAEIFGASLRRDAWTVRRLVGLAPQEISLYPELTADENLSFFGRLYGLGATRLLERADELLDLVGLLPRRRDRVATYSGGMRRRLNLACSLLHAPRLLLLDEPTVGVDPQSRDRIFDAIRELARDGKTILYSTHYMEEAERLCDRITILDEGRVVAAGTLGELLQIVGMGEIVELSGLGEELGDGRLASIPGITKVERGERATRLFVESAARALPAIAAIVAPAGERLQGVQIYPVNLERVFMHLTGKQLRD
jgi:ABC-2 type transport system ATP-binding protein